jgi:2'-hydroxyisoflavone reductase
MNAGLSCRPVTQTVDDTWAWLSALDATERESAVPGLANHGMSAEQERALLALGDGRSRSVPRRGAAE